jgi:3-deoxy-D-manno-octulosonic-acid transferase
MDNFKNNQLCLVAGSTWPEDEAILIDYINHTKERLKLVIAPHQIKPSHIEKITAALKKKYGLLFRTGQPKFKGGGCTDH